MPPVTRDPLRSGRKALAPLQPNLIHPTTPHSAKSAKQVSDVSKPARAGSSRQTKPSNPPTELESAPTIIQTATTIQQESTAGSIPTLTTTNLSTTEQCTPSTVSLSPLQTSPPTSNCPGSEPTTSVSDSVPVTLAVKRTRRGVAAPATGFKRVVKLLASEASSSSGLDDDNNIATMVSSIEMTDTDSHVERQAVMPNSVTQTQGDDSDNNTKLVDTKSDTTDGSDDDANTHEDDGNVGSERRGSTSASEKGAQPSRQSRKRHRLSGDLSYTSTLRHSHNMTVDVDADDNNDHQTGSLHRSSLSVPYGKLAKAALSSLADDVLAVLRTPALPPSIKIPDTASPLSAASTTSSSTVETSRPSLSLNVSSPSSTSSLSASSPLAPHFHDLKEALNAMSVPPPTNHTDTIASQSTPTSTPTPMGSTTTLPYSSTSTSSTTMGSKGDPSIVSRLHSSHMALTERVWSLLGDQAILTNRNAILASRAQQASQVSCSLFD